MKESKKNDVLKHLKRYKSITSMTAFEKYGATRLSAIIFNLRKEGWNIITEEIEIKDRHGNNCRYANYILKK